MPVNLQVPDSAEGAKLTPGHVARMAGSIRSKVLGQGDIEDLLRKLCLRPVQLPDDAAIHVDEDHVVRKIDVQFGFSRPRRGVGVLVIELALEDRLEKPASLDFLNVQGIIAAGQNNLSILCQ